MISNKNRSKRGPKRGLNEVFRPLSITTFYQVLPFKLYQKGVQNHAFDHFLTTFWPLLDQHLTHLNDSPCVFFPDPQIRGSKPGVPQNGHRSTLVMFLSKTAQNWSILTKTDQNRSKIDQKSGFFSFWRFLPKSALFSVRNSKSPSLALNTSKIPKSARGGSTPYSTPLIFEGSKKGVLFWPIFSSKTGGFWPSPKMLIFSKIGPLKTDKSDSPFDVFMGPKMGPKNGPLQKVRFYDLKFLDFGDPAKIPDFDHFFQKNHFSKKRGHFWTFLAFS